MQEIKNGKLFFQVSEKNVRKPVGTLRMTDVSKNTRNYLRELSESVVAATTSKEHISMSIGDPTLYGNLTPPKCLLEAMQTAASDPKNYSYPPSVGLQSTREAVARIANKKYSIHKVSFDDVVLTSGCSGAIELTFKALLGKHNSILIPNPAFGLYEVVLNSAGLKYGRYLLNPANNFEVDLEFLRSQLEADPSIEAIIMNNPSNPCGTVFTEEHIHDILQVAASFNIVIVADEIYGDIVFEGAVFHPFAAVRDKFDIKVDIITVSGVAKEMCVPGVRLGWAIFNEAHQGRLANVKAGVKNLTMLSMGPNSITQHMLSKILDLPELDVYKKQLAMQIQTQSRYFVQGINSISERHPSLRLSLKAEHTNGAMYVIIRIVKGAKFVTDYEAKIVESDCEISETMNGMQLFKELKKFQNISFLPGCVFGDTIKNCLRAVVVAPKDVLQEVLDRIEDYLVTHHA